MQRVVATILSVLALVFSTACEPEQSAAAPSTGDGPQEVKPGKKSGQEQPPKKDTAKPKQPDLGVPKLTGDKAKDTKAVQNALVMLKTEWDNNSKLLAAMMKLKKPDQKKVAELKERNASFQKRAEKLQDMLGKLRQ